MRKQWPKTNRARRGHNVKPHEAAKTLTRWSHINTFCRVICLLMPMRNISHVLRLLFVVPELPTAPMPLVISVPLENSILQSRWYTPFFSDLVRNSGINFICFGFKSSPCCYDHQYGIWESQRRRQVEPVFKTTFPGSGEMIQWLREQLLFQRMWV